MFVLPWAVPGFVTILVFAGMFNDSFGAINNDILAFFSISPIPWMTDALWTRVALILIQGWLGFPYIFIVTTGILQSIPEDLYEAAVIDGATSWDKFMNITLPVILTSMAPTLITQTPSTLITSISSICSMAEDQRLPALRRRGTGHSCVLDLQINDAVQPICFGCSASILIFVCFCHRDCHVAVQKIQFVLTKRGDKYEDDKKSQICTLILFLPDHCILCWDHCLPSFVDGGRQF